MSSEYDRKFAEMKKYIPFLESMINRLETTTGTSSTNPRIAQLDKIRSLRDLLLDKKKRMKMDNLLKCEQVLINLYNKVEQRDSVPCVKEKSDNIFDVDSPTAKEKTVLDNVRNKLKIVSKMQEEGTLPEIARANQIEEPTVGKEPALFQRRTNKSPIRHPGNSSFEPQMSHCETQNTKRSYTRVLLSPVRSPSRRQLSSETLSKPLFKRRSPRISPRRYSPSYNKRDRKKSLKRSEELSKLKDLNITLNVPEERLHSLNTKDILSRIINCSDNDVDINTLRELRTQILGELKQTGTTNDISDLLLKSYKKKKKSMNKHKKDIEEGEISDSESEAIESIYGSLVVVDKDKSTTSSTKKTEKDGDLPRKIQICLVINADKQSPKAHTEVQSVDISDLEMFEDEPKSLTKPVEGEISNFDLTDGPTLPTKSEVNNKEFSVLEQGNSSSVKTGSNSIKINEEGANKHMITKTNNPDNVNCTETIPKTDTQFKANFYKPLHDEESLEKNDTVLLEMQEKRVQQPKANTMPFNTPSKLEKNVDIPLLNESVILSKPDITNKSEKANVSEIDILQALKNEILSESIAIPGTEVISTPPLHQPKLIKVASAKELLPKKKISIEKYKEKSVTSTVKQMFKSDSEKSLYKKGNSKKSKIKLTEKECERFNLPPRLSLDEEVSSNDENDYNNDILLDDIYGDLAPKSPDDNNSKGILSTPPVIIPSDPVKGAVVSPKVDIDMRTLPLIISPNLSVDSNSSNVTQERVKETTSEAVQKQLNHINDKKKIPMDPRIRKELINNSPNPERTPRSMSFSNPNMTPNSRSYEMTPNSRSYEMTPSHHSFEIDLPSNKKHVYAPFASFDLNDKREQSVSIDNLTSWDQAQDENRVSRNKYSQRETYQSNVSNDSSYRRGAKVERYKIDRREEFRPSHSSTSGSSFLWADNSTPFGRSECPTTPSHPFGRSECPTTPSHPFGRSECPTTPSHPFGRSECPNTPSHPFGRSECPTTPSHPFGRSECPTTPSHPFGRSDFDRKDVSINPGHGLGRTDRPLTPSHSFGRSDCPSTPNHPYGRSDLPKKFNRQKFHNDSRWNESVYDKDIDYYNSYKDISYEGNNSYRSQNRFNDLDSRNYRYNYRNDHGDKNRYFDLLGRNYSRDYFPETRDMRTNSIASENRDYSWHDDNYRSYDDKESHYERSIGNNKHDDLRSRSRATSVGRTFNTDYQSNKTLFVKPDAARSFKIDTSVNTTFQNFMLSKGLQILNENFDARRSRAASVGRSLQREPSIGRVSGQNSGLRLESFRSNINKDRYQRASSVGRELTASNSGKCFKDIKADFEAFKSKLKFDTKRTSNSKDTNSDGYRISVETNGKKYDFEDDRNTKKAYIPRRNYRDPRLRCDRPEYNRTHNKKYMTRDSREKKNHGIIYSSDNIARGISLGSGYGVKNYKIPKLKSVIEEKEREERLRKEKEEKAKKEKEEREKREKEEKEKERKEKEEKERKEKEEKLRKENEEKEEKLRKEKEEKLRKEREEKLVKEQEEKLRKEMEEKEKKAKEEKEKERKEKEVKERIEKEEKERLDREQKEKLDREKTELEEKKREDIAERLRQSNERKQREENEKKESLWKEIREKIEMLRKESIDREKEAKERIEMDKMQSFQKEKTKHQGKEKRMETENEDKIETHRFDTEKNQDHQESNVLLETKRKAEEIGLSTTDTDGLKDGTHKLDCQAKGNLLDKENPENNEQDSSAIRSTRPSVKLVNIDSTDEIHKKSLDFDSGSVEQTLKMKALARMHPKKSDQSPTKNNELAFKNYVESNFEVDESDISDMFGDTVTSDSVIENINALIANLDNDIDTSKTDFIQNSNNEINFENITVSQRTEFSEHFSKGCERHAITDSSENEKANKIENTDNIVIEKTKSENIMERDTGIDNISMNIISRDLSKLNNENVVSTSEIDKSDLNISEIHKGEKYNSKNNDDCSLPDSTIVNDSTLDKNKEMLNVHSNESNIDMTSLDKVESSTKYVVEPSSSQKDVESLDNIGNLLSLLKDDSKLEELMSMSGVVDNEKLKKKLKKFRELLLDDDDDNTNDASVENKDSDMQNVDVILEKDDQRQDLAGEIGVENNNDDTLKHYNSAYNSNSKQNNTANVCNETTIFEITQSAANTYENNRSVDSVCGNIITEDDFGMDKNNEENVSKSHIGTETIDPKHTFDEEINADNLEESDEVNPEVIIGKTVTRKFNKYAKNTKGKFVKKALPKKALLTEKEVLKTDNEKPKRKKATNELQRLHQDIRETFMYNDILNSTGIRMCRLAKMIDKKETEQKDHHSSTLFQEPKPVVVLNKCLDTKLDVTQSVKTRNKPGPKPKSKKLQDGIFQVFKPKSAKQPGPKSKKNNSTDTELDPYEFETDSITESIQTKQICSDSDSSDENCSLASSSKSASSNEVLSDLKKKKRKRGSWQTGVIKPKNKKKKVEHKQVDNLEDGLTLPKANITIPDLNCFVDKLYCFQNKLETYSCRLCVYTGTDIIHHYKQKHPHTEIPLSRFTPNIAKEAIEQSENINFQAFSKIPSNTYTCRFCFQEFSKSKSILETFFWHVVSTHTGEYKQACSECDDVTQCPFNLDIPASPKDSKGQLIGYICEKCNFTQISLENLKTHVIVRHNDEQTVVYTINLSSMSKKKLNIFMRKCKASTSTTTRKTRSNNTAERSDDQSDVTESESDTQSTPKKHTFISPIKPKVSNSPNVPKQFQSKITFESEDTNTQDIGHEANVKTENENFEASNDTNISENCTELNTSEEVPTIESLHENEDENFSADIKAIAHFKVSHTETGGMEYVCSINGDDHFRTIKLISLKQHARKHSESWDGYCILCKVIVTPQGLHKFIDCLQHFIDVHMGEFPVMERVQTPVVDVAPILSNSDELAEAPKSYINVRPLSDLLLKPVEEQIREHSSPSPKIHNVVSLTQATVELPRPSPSYPTTSQEKPPERTKKYEEWQAQIMSMKHRVVLGTMMTKENLIKVFKCAGRFCSFTSDNAEDSLLHASTHQRIGGTDAMYCSYCDFDTSDNAIDLVMHVFRVHSRCQYACGLCFYRAAASQLVGAHLAYAHPKFTKDGNVLRTTNVTTPVVEDHYILPREQAVHYYVCTESLDPEKKVPCSFRTYTPVKYCEHLLNKHKPPYTCAECNESQASPSDMVVHMKSHGYKLYQCTWCVHGAEKEDELISHVASNHPDKQPQAYIRMITSKKGTQEYRVLPLAYLNKSKVPTEDVMPSKSDDPIREAERSIQLEKLIGHSARVEAVAIKPVESDMVDDAEINRLISDDELPSSSLDTDIIQTEEDLEEQSSTEIETDNPTPLVTSVEQSTQSSEPLPTELAALNLDIQSPENNSSDLETSPSGSPILSITTVTLPTNSLPFTKTAATPSLSPLTAVIKVEPLASTSQVVSEVLPESDVEDMSQEIINLSDDESPTFADNRVEVRQRLVKCPNCPTSYVSTAALRRHLRQCMQFGGDMKCSYYPCGKILKSIEELFEHFIKDHSSEQMVECSVCGTYLKTLAEVKKHLKVIHNIDKIRVKQTTGRPKSAGLTNKDKAVSDLMREFREPDVISYKENLSNPNAALPVVPSSDVQNVASVFSHRSPLQSTVISTASLTNLSLLTQESIASSVSTQPTMLATVTPITSTTQVAISSDCLPTPTSLESGTVLPPQSLGIEHPSLVSLLGKKKLNMTLDAAELKDKQPDPPGQTPQVVLSDSDDEESRQFVIDLSDDEPIVTYEHIDPKLLYKCPKCKSVYKSGGGLHKHMTTSGHSLMPTKCPHLPCTRKINWLDELFQHYNFEHFATNSKSSKNENLFKCTLCKVTARVFDEIKQHIVQVHKMEHVSVKPAKKSGHFNVTAKQGPVKKIPKDSTPSVFRPEDIELLPIKPILDKSVRCSLCKFNTKVRLNMVRHLQLHLEQQQVPQKAPVNPVPHLETNEKHFDKMLNYASSSIMTRGPEKQKSDSMSSLTMFVPLESVSKYPKFIPERQRLTCGARGCSYISVDEAMLKYHWETLHSGSNDYHCVHCPPNQHLDTTKTLTASRVITHLKMHDATLYACSSCSFYHYSRNMLEKHLTEEHTSGSVMIVRDETPVAVQQPATVAPTMDLKAWQCGLCKFKSMLHPQVVEHCSKFHNSKMQYKCSYCPFRTSTFENVTKHQANSHADKVEDVFFYYYREGSVPNDPDGVPKWVKQRQKMPEQAVKTELPDPTLPAESTPSQAAVVEAGASTSRLAVDLNKVKTEVEEVQDVELSIEELCKRYGDFCLPNGLKYKCSLCNLECLDTKEAMESHLYEELQYRKFGCGLCSYKAFHLEGFREHMLSEHRHKKQDFVELPADNNIERWVQALLDYQTEFILKSKQMLNSLKKAAAASVTAAPAKAQNSFGVEKSQKPQYSEEELVTSLGSFGAASDGKYCCPKCDFVSTEYQVMKGHLEVELGSMRWTCSMCSEKFLSFHQVQYHCRSAHAWGTAKPISVASQVEMRNAWVEAVLTSQRAALATPTSRATPNNDADPDNSLLVVRYEENVSEQVGPTRKRRLSTSDGGPLTAEPEPKKATKMKCPYCNYKSKNWYIGHCHILKHYNLMPFECSHCPYTTVKPGILSHLQNFHPGLPQEYKRTQIPNRPPPDLNQKHGTEHEKMVCLLCQRALPANKIQAHSHGNEKPEYAVISSTVYNCCICSILILNMKSLEEHHNGTHPDIPMNYTHRQLSNVKDLLQCSSCDKTFKFDKELQSHCATEHGPSMVAGPSGIGGSGGGLTLPSSMKCVARKSTTKLPTEKAFARKSTTKLPDSIDSEYSYYGTKPSMTEYEDVTTLMPFCNTIMSFTVKKLNDIINIHPRVVLEDIDI